MSRIRQIKPSWFLDKELRRGTTADAREFYIGLWMLADDDGWLVWDEERIAAELYPFEGISKRERNVAKWSDQLERLNPKTPHLVVYDCGHASVPKMKAHQRIAGTRTVRVRADHESMCRRVRSRVSLQEATERESLDMATRSHGGVVVGERNGTVGIDAGGRVNVPASEFDEQIAAHGGVGFRPTVVKTA